MSKQGAIQEINEKIYQWKTAFAQKVADVSGEQMPANVMQLSYADILTSGEENTVSLRDVASILQQEGSRIGFFSAEAKQILHTTEYQDARMIADALISFSSEAEFEAIRQEGPIVEGRERGHRMASILHNRPFKMVEMFYETNDETVTQLSDAFVLNLNLGAFYTIKAVKDLNENPILKQYIQALDR